MPVYEYVCKRCGREFEELVRGDEQPACPACESRDLEKRFSVFATGGGTPEMKQPGSCGTCGDPRGPGACASV